MDYYFARIGERTFTPTKASMGAWSADDYHFASLAGLVVYELEREFADTGMQLSRISYDILGRLPLQDVTVATEVIRPGKAIQLVRATVTIAEREAVLVDAWYMAHHDTSEVASEFAPEFPGPDECEKKPFDPVWGDGFVTTIDGRIAPAKKDRSVFGWVSATPALVKDEPRNAFAQYCTAIDVANGITITEDPAEWICPNVDLTIHFYRRPEGEWVGLESKNRWGATGVGLTSTALHDINGPVGRAQQLQSVQRTPKP